MAANPIGVPSSLHVQAQTLNGRTIVKCNGRLTSESADDFRLQIKEIIPTTKSMVIDLSNVSYMDSSGLGALVGAYVSARRAGCEMRLMNLNQRLAELLRLTKLASVFEGYGEYL